MAQEDLNPAVAYLRALKQPLAAHTAAGAAPAREVPAQAAPNPEGSQTGIAGHFTGADKRRSPRYKCEGSVQLREQGCDVHTWATFTDVSVHGCYVEAQATYPAGTMLHMKLDASGIRMEVTGEVRINYPYLGMGIAFRKVSDENAALLRQLVVTTLAPQLNHGPWHRLVAARRHFAFPGFLDHKSASRHSSAHGILRESPDADARRLSATDQEKPVFRNRALKSRRACDRNHTSPKPRKISVHRNVL